jgi:N-acetylglucosamine kinase-like BadF-type ATPase
MIRIFFILLFCFAQRYGIFLFLHSYTHLIFIMKIIVESGATKAAWRAISVEGNVTQVLTPGLSPTCLDAEYISDIVRKAIPILNPEGKRVGQIVFYGAGLVSEESAGPVRSCLEMWCPFATVEFHSDILAAARALFGDGSGVVAIMGTGSNSCLYENGRIVKNIRPGGYVLGDEGSGVALGRAFLADFVKGLLPESIESEFSAQTGLDYPGIVRKVYKEQAASAFLASLAPFVLSHMNEPCIRLMVRDCLESFVKRSLSRYAAFAGDAVAASKVGVVGSFGCACEDMLREIGHEYGLDFVAFLKSPIDQLVKYHCAYGL